MGHGQTISRHSGGSSDHSCHQRPRVCKSWMFVGLRLLLILLAAFGSMSRVHSHLSFCN